MHNAPTPTPGELAMDVTIRLPHGLHSRPSARLAQKAREFESTIRLATREKEVDAKSMLDLLSLALQQNDSARILASGIDAAAALQALSAILQETGGQDG